MKQARATSFITLVRDVYDLFMDIGHVLVCKLSVLFEIQYDSHWYSFWTENHDGNLKVVWLTPIFQTHVSGNRWRYTTEFQGK